ncbi:hypothetical protein ACFOWE_17495 [Planomonospora corallina]|uniref:NB-ARC domain-containing protein n=1 Tax=Planomonospora corallina TaxID=1806052 RepID=A0ABV8IAS6_9ACTN
MGRPERPDRARRNAIVSDRLEELWKASAAGYRARTGGKLTQFHAAREASLLDRNRRPANRRVSAWIRGDELPEAPQLLSLVRTLIRLGDLRKSVDELHPGHRIQGRLYEDHWKIWLRRAQGIRDVQGSRPRTAAAGRMDGAGVGTPLVLDRLPPQLAAEIFVGRNGRLRGTCGVLHPDRDFRGALLVVGAAGVGKTAFAVQVARRCVESRWFPGGLLFLNLQGYDAERRVDTDAALAGILPAMGTSPRHIPRTPEAKLRLYHQEAERVEAERGRMLIFADNIADPRQLAELMPPAPHVLLATSRQAHADAHGVRLVRLDALNTETSTTLITSAVRHTIGHLPRQAGNRVKLAELARLCDRLPLALRIMSALIAAEPSATIDSLIDRMADMRLRSHRTRFGDTAVDRSLSLSYEHLDPEQQRTFRLVSSHPGRHISVASCAALLDRPLHRAEDLIGELRRAHLLIMGAGPAWIRMHDLVRSFGLSLASDPEYAQEHDEATDRVLSYYEELASSVTESLGGEALPDDETLVERRAHLLSEMDRERTSAVGVIQLAARLGRHREACRLSLLMAPYFKERLRHSDWVRTAETAKEASTCVDDRTRGLTALNLGEAMWAARDFRQSVAHHRRALEILGETGGAAERAMAGIGLGSALWRLGHLCEAEQHLISAEELARESDAGIRARALAALGNVWADSGRLEDAIRCQREAANAHDLLRQRADGALARVNLASSLWRAGDHDLALKELKRGAGDLERWGDLFSYALATTSLANAHACVGMIDEALRLHREARAMFRRLGDQYGVGRASWNLGKVMELHGDAEAARSEMEIAEQLLSRYEHQHGHTVSIIRLDGGGHPADGHSH